MFCHWFTVLGMIVLLAVCFSIGMIPRAEKFAEKYQTSIGTITG